MPLDRRIFLVCGAAFAACGRPWAARAAAKDPYAGSPWRSLSQDAWRQRLPPDSFEVLRLDGTERPFTSPLLREHRHGLFVCLGCGLPLFRSEWKYDSGTGWPSFWTEMPGSLGKKADYQLIEKRTEYHCAQCLGHQGHVFDDGPRPTGLRYCNNGVALRFAPA